MKKANFTGVILAGGASRRMGTDKAILCINGTSLIDIMTDKLLAAGANNIKILGRSNVDGGIPDKRPGDGPVAATLDYLNCQVSGTKHLFVPVDMPALPVGLLSKLAAENYWAYFHENYMPFLAVADNIHLTKPERLQDLLLIKLAKKLDLPSNKKAWFSNLNHPSEFTSYVNSAPKNKPILELK